MRSISIDYRLIKWPLLLGNIVLYCSGMIISIWNILVLICQCTGVFGFPRNWTFVKKWEIWTGPFKQWLNSMSCSGMEKSFGATQMERNMTLLPHPCFRTRILTSCLKSSWTIAEYAIMSTGYERDHETDSRSVENVLLLLCFGVGIWVPAV